MRKRISQFSSSLAALLNKQTSTGNEGQVSSIRQAMLQSVQECAGDEVAESLDFWADVERAYDIQTLWYLRNDMMRVLAQFSGEGIARKKLDVITEMFRGLVHQSQLQKPRLVRS